MFNNGFLIQNEANVKAPYKLEFESPLKDDPDLMLGETGEPWYEELHGKDSVHLANEASASVIIGRGEGGAPVSVILVVVVEHLFSDFFSNKNYNEI